MSRKFGQSFNGRTPSAKRLSASALVGYHLTGALNLGVFGPSFSAPNARPHREQGGSGGRPIPA